MTARIVSSASRSICRSQVINGDFVLQASCLRFSWSLPCVSGGVDRYRSFSGVAEPGKASEPSEMEIAVSEQQKLLFPRLQRLEVAQQRRDELLRQKASSQDGEWSPQQVPYKQYNKQSDALDDSSDDESDAEEPEEDSPSALNVSAPEILAENGGQSSADRDSYEELLADESQESPIEEELGFRYNGPEPTLHGDW
eukprot:CAMPEP_0169230308 /NCGR_PEP_ID=MMETSP1016-20121227/25855_1 /TAXON_ID=342587 /ORGANISM="Karlodinium micrum, Strain CCMP2283" /LENGTH=196 /DNA_ID=CAMNT_0009309259 /DNA_START=69 /DNA_END=656 /DNA_ORIENTATION=-